MAEHETLYNTWANRLANRLDSVTAASFFLRSALTTGPCPACGAGDVRNIADIVREEYISRIERVEETCRSRILREISEREQEMM